MLSHICYSTLLISQFRFPRSTNHRCTNLSIIDPPTPFRTRRRLIVLPRKIRIRLIRQNTFHQPRLTLQTLRPLKHLIYRNRQLTPSLGLQSLSTCAVYTLLEPGPSNRCCALCSHQSAKPRFFAQQERTYHRTRLSISIQTQILPCLSRLFPTQSPSPFLLASNKDFGAIVDRLNLPM